MSRTNLILIIIGAIIVIGGGIYLLARPGGPGQLDDFAKCLKNNGAAFYGAFWCPHCQNQKAEFGSSAQYLPYVECSTADAQGQLPACRDKKIESYPTWEFKDGSRLSGEIALKTLAEKTGCSLPAGNASHSDVGGRSVTGGPAGK